MAVSPVNITRVSHNLRTSLVLETLRRTQRDLFISQARIATGRSFVSPSENPIAALRALDLTAALARQNQFSANARHGDNFLAAQDAALTEVNDLVTQASVIANQMVNSLSSEAERESEAELVDALRRQLQALGNRQVSGRYIFAGRSTLDRPFIDALGGIAYVGDTGHLYTRVDNQVLSSINLPGNEVFGALSRPIDSTVDLTPNIVETMRLDEFNGASGEGLLPGVLVFNEPSGVGVFTVDLAQADTIGDVVTLINDAAEQAGSTLSAALGDRGLDITPGGEVVITDRAAGAVAASFGILTIQPTSGTIEGVDLGPRVTRLTSVEALAGGDGIDLENGLIITNGGETVTVDLSAAETVQDIINIINNAGVYVSARVNDTGTGIDVFNLVSGQSLRIGENGGTTATELGIRTFDLATSLDRLNLGIGVETMEGQDDLRITARNGSTVDVNLDTAQTVGDVIDLINQAAEDAGVAVEASFTDTGNGILISDSTGGAGPLSVAGVNLSIAPLRLGLVKTVIDPAEDLIGDDVNPTRTDGVFGALIELEHALRADDTQAISLAGERLDSLRSEITRMHGVVGARSQAMMRKQQQLNTAVDATRILLSEVQDLDYAEAATEMQAALTQLQANLQASSSILGLSLMDFLR